MKNIILASAIFAASCAAQAQIIQVSAPYVADVSSPAIIAPQDSDAKLPKGAVAANEKVEPASVIAMGCCTVSVSAPQVAQAQDEGEGSVALASLGFGLVGLIGVSKLARRKKQKSEGIGGA